MPGKCYSSIQGLAMRATRVDACGSPLTGATAKVVSDGFVNIGLSAQVEEGEDYTRKNAAGKLCIAERGQTQLARYDLEMQFCQVDPELFELATGIRLITDYAGNSVGFAVDQDLSGGGNNNWGLEVWTKVPASPDAPCVAGGAGTFVYWLLPWITDGRVGDFTIEDASATFTINASTKRGNKWGRGPYNVVPIDAGNTPGILDTPGVKVNEHLYNRLTTIAPPTVGCGYAA